MGRRPHGHVSSYGGLRSRLPPPFVGASSSPNPERRFAATLDSREEQLRLRARHLLRFFSSGQRLLGGPQHHTPPWMRRVRGGSTAPGVSVHWLLPAHPGPHQQWEIGRS
eukprot:9491398-Pyramimonas_sp.AAC.1